MRVSMALLVGASRAPPVQLAPLVAALTGRALPRDVRRHERPVRRVDGHRGTDG